MIDVPDFLAHLDRDHRGYPIPVIVFRDPRDGKAHFAINDETARDRVIAADLCGICGRALHRGRWFVGGPLSAFHERGAFRDPPMHHQCATFSLQACPYLAHEKFVRTVADRTLQSPTLLFDHTMIPDRPALFISAMAIGQSMTDGGSIIPKKPWRRVEYWQHGRQLADADGAAMVATIMAQPVPEPTSRGMFIGGAR